jgi:hypothetical protein
MDPVTVTAMAAQTAGSMLGGSNQPKDQTSWYVAPEQLATLKALLAQLYTGGEAGLGSDLKAGNATLAQMLANSGAAPTSGTSTAARASMVAQAVAKANQNRVANLSSLISAQPAMVSGKIGNPDVEGYAWRPYGLTQRNAYESPYGTYDATMIPGSDNYNSQMGLNKKTNFLTSMKPAGY